MHRKSDKLRLACGNFRLFYDADSSATVGPVPAETRILGNGTMNSAPFPNATTSTNTVISTASASGQTSAPGTSTEVATIPAGSTSTAGAGATASKSSPMSVQTGSGAEQGAQIRIWALALELCAVAVFASYLG